MPRPTITEMAAQTAELCGPLAGAAATAELLVALAHDNRDYDVWGGERALTYWDRVPDRIRTACYRGPRLASWWEAMTRSLGCGQPRRVEDRETLARALACGDDAAVLDVLRTETEMLVLRVRLAAQAQREARQAATMAATIEEEEPL